MSEVLVPLKAGTASQPLFLAHGMGGSVDEFRDLVKFIRTERPIYGLQAKRNGGVAQPFERIEDLAGYFLEAIKKVQPRGPYFLIGYSLGGLVALEMAQQLSSSADTVALLAMLDSYPHPKRFALWQRIRLASRRVKLAIMNPSKRFNRHFKSSAPGSKNQIASTVQSGSEIMRRAYDSAYCAWTRYQPRFYEGKIHFVKAEAATIYPENPVAVWRNLAGDIEVQTVPGDHHEIMTKHFEILGSVLSRWIAKASERLS